MSIRSWQYILTGGVGLLSFLSILGIERFPKVFYVFLLVWMLLLAGIYFFFKQTFEWRFPFLPLALCTSVTSTALYSIVEDLGLKRAVLLLIVVIMSTLFGWGLEGSRGFFKDFKPFRRFVMMTWVFNVYACASFLFAIRSFFSSPLALVLVSVVGTGIVALVCGAVAVMIWRQYFEGNTKILLFWGGLVAFVCFQLMWMLQLLPFAYLVLGFFATWIWYIMQLLIRFHFSKEGIVWKNQASFLITNGALMGALLFFFVRWV